MSDMPPVGDVEEEFDFDPENIVVNVSEKEASATFEELPAGKYHCIIDEVKIEKSQSEKNFGKPMYNIMFSVVETGDARIDKYVGRKIFTRACLWGGALYTILGIVEALTGERPAEGDFRVPRIDELLGRELIVQMRMGKPGKGKDRLTGEEVKYEARMEARGFYGVGKVQVTVPRVQATAGVASSGGSSILP